MINDILRSGQYKASICLLCIFVLSIPLLYGPSIYAKNGQSITITQGFAAEEEIDGTKTIHFSAYYTSTDSSIYALHICKTKKIASDGLCIGGSWCDSPSFTGDNPLSCSYSLDGSEDTEEDYFMFVCNDTNQCSNYVYETFSSSQATNALSLQAPPQAAFKPLQFSFLPQQSADNPLGDILISSRLYDGPGWSIDARAQDWASDGGNIIDYDGDGQSSGRLTIDFAAASIEPSRGIRLGKTASFSPTLRAINIATADRKNGSGTFTLRGLRFDQEIPGNQQRGDYKTIVTFTIF